MKHRIAVLALFAGMCGLLSPFAQAGPLTAPQLKWSRGGCTSWCMTGWYASPAAVDLDGNGTVEVIWASYKLWVLDGATGNEIWSVYTGHDIHYTGDDYVGRTWPSPAIADVDADGISEIVTAHSGGWVCVYAITGEFKPGWPVQAAPESELRSLAVYDLDRDGTMEIITASTSFGSDEEWYVLEHDGAQRTGWPQHTGDCYAAGCFNQNIAVADIDNDDLGEIVGPNDTHYICAFHHDGACIPAHPMYDGRYWGQVGVWVDLVAELRGWGYCGTEHRPNFCHSAPVIADLDGSGSLEIVHVGNVHNCDTSPYTDLYELPIVLNADRSRFNTGGFDWTVWPAPPGAGAWAPLSQDYNVIENCQPNPTVGDVDHDGIMEIFYPAYDGKVHGFKLTGAEFGQWPYSVTRSGEGFIRFASEVAAADLNGDGQVEIIFGSWPEKATELPGKLHILTAFGQPLFELDLPVAPGHWNGMLGSPTLADIDGDGELELVAGTSHTGAVAYDLPGATDWDILWGTSRGSYLRNGAMETELPPMTVDVSSSQPVYSAGDTLRILFGFDNPRNATHVDLYLFLMVYGVPVFVSADPSWPTFTGAPARLTFRPLPGPYTLDPLEIITLPLGADPLPAFSLDWFAAFTSADTLHLLAWDTDSTAFN